MSVSIQVSTKDAHTGYNATAFVFCDNYSVDEGCGRWGGIGFGLGNWTLVLKTD